MSQSRLTRPPPPSDRARAPQVGRPTFAWLPVAGLCSGVSQECRPPTRVASRPIPALAGLLESTVEVATARFGPATTERVLGQDRWVMYRGSGWSLRVRARQSSPGVPARVRSWTVAFEEGYESLADACEALGLRPVILGPRPPDVSSAEPCSSAEPRSSAQLPSGAEPPTLLRCALRDDRSSRVHSLTASRGPGGIRSVTAFDEPPDWESEASG